MVRYCLAQPSYFGLIAAGCAIYIFLIARTLSVSSGATERFGASARLRALSGIAGIRTDYAPGLFAREMAV
jgi:hypothetical protein